MTDHDLLRLRLLASNLELNVAFAMHALRLAAAKAATQGTTR